MSNVFLRLRRFIPRKGAIALTCAVILCAALAADRGIGLLGQVQIFGSTTTPGAPAGYPVLDACPGNSGIFFPARLSIDDWIRDYHATVSDLFMQDLTIPIPADCRSPDAEAGEVEASKLPSIALLKNRKLNPIVRPPPGTSLKEVAAELAPWQKPEDLENLSEWDLGSVLLELLRVYECALQQRERGLVPYVLDQMAAASSASGANTIGAAGTIPVITLNTNIERQKIDIELKTARPALRRALTAISGRNQIEFLIEPLDCLERASFDIRNEFGLAATASTCLPRIWNARGGTRAL